MCERERERGRERDVARERDFRETQVVPGYADVRASAVMTNDNNDDGDDGNFDDTLSESFDDTLSSFPKVCNATFSAATKKS